MNPNPTESRTLSSPAPMFHYGWVMVVAAAVAMVATLPGRTHGLGMITERLLADPDLQLTRSGFGQMNFWATLIGSLFCLGIGSSIDRFGIRRVLIIVMALLGIAVLAMTSVTSTLSLFLVILLTRGFGQSALSVISISIIGKWFHRRVSLPMALYSVLIAGGFILAARMGREYADVDWRVFWSGLGWSVLALGGILILLVRDAPDSPNHRPPAEDDSQTDPSRSRSPDEVCGSPDEVSGDYTHREALRTPMFWVCSLSISLYGMIVAGVSLFNESILVEQGFRKEVYYEALAWGAGIGVVAKLGAGLMGLRIPINRLLAIALLLLAGSLTWLTQLSSYPEVVGYVALNAIAGGMLTVLFFSAWPALFGRRHLGKIQGSAQMLTVVASAVGPLLFSQAHSLSGSYIPLLWLLSLLVVATGFIAWFTPLPEKKSSQPVPETGRVSGGAPLDSQHSSKHQPILTGGP